MSHRLLSRRRLLQTGVLCATTPLAGCSIPGNLVVERSTATVDAADVDTVTVDNTNGDVTVRPTDADQVAVRVEKRTRFGESRLADASLTTDRGGGTLAVAVEYGERARQGRVTVHLTVSLPDGVAIEEARSVNGSVRASGVAGDPALASTNGDVTATDVDGFVSLESNNGDLSASGVAGTDRSVTTNGDTDLEVPAIREDVRVAALNGDIELALGDLDARLVATADNGEVAVQGIELAGRESSRTRVAGTLGDGGRDLTVSTVNGEVVIRPL